jgi:MFS transporter, PAT family, solute carrier family 33 (acetyl-CoA transportor), member 1
MLINSISKSLLHFEEFMYFFGIVFIVATTLVLLFKKEVPEVKESDNEMKESLIINDGQSDNEDEEEEEQSIEDDLSVKDAYKLMWRVIWLKPVQHLILILMTVKVFILLNFIIH